MDLETEDLAECLREAVELFEMDDDCNDVGSDRWIWLQRSRMALAEIDGDLDGLLAKAEGPIEPFVFTFSPDLAAGEALIKSEFGLPAQHAYIPPRIEVGEMNDKGEVTVLIVTAQFRPPPIYSFNVELKCSGIAEPDVMEMTNDEILYAKVRD